MSLTLWQKEKKNLQDLNGVYVFNVPEREQLDNLTARFIKEFDRVEGTLMVSAYKYNLFKNLIAFDETK